jgi:hypothetical protein
MLCGGQKEEERGTFLKSSLGQCCQHYDSDALDNLCAAVQTEAITSLRLKNECSYWEQDSFS